MIRFYGHPFSSYCMKVLVALYENEIPFAWHSTEDEGNRAALRQHWPFGKMPVIVDGEHTVSESSIIIEHLGSHHPGKVRLVPDDAPTALAVRFMDRVFDLYVHTPSQAIVFDALRDPADRNAKNVRDARATMDTAYAWLDAQLAGRTWACGEFSLADCAAAPALFYADWTHPIAAAHTHLRAYRARLSARPSFARCIEEARPFRSYFPLGAPDRD